MAVGGLGGFEELFRFAKLCGVVGEAIWVAGFGRLAKGVTQCIAGDGDFVQSQNSAVGDASVAGAGHGSGVGRKGVEGGLRLGEELCVFGLLLAEAFDDLRWGFGGEGFVRELLVGGGEVFL